MAPNGILTASPGSFFQGLSPGGAEIQPACRKWAEKNRIGAGSGRARADFSDFSEIALGGPGTIIWGVGAIIRLEIIIGLALISNVFIIIPG